jgi:hypothetical protein
MTCHDAGCSGCGRDRRFCLLQGWISHRRADGGVEIRFTCPALELRIYGPRTGAVAWTLATAAAGDGFTVRERGYSRRLLTAANDVADALRRANLAGWAAPREIAVAIVVAESRARHDLAPASAGT